jgi:hypothetical protein
MSGAAERARSILDEAGLLPDDRGDATAQSPDRAGPSETVANSMYRVVLFLVAVAAVLVLLMMLLG